MASREITHISSSTISRVLLYQSPKFQTPNFSAIYHSTNSPPRRSTWVLLLMGEKPDTSRRTTEPPIRIMLPKIIDPAILGLFSQIPQKLQNFIQCRFKRPKREENENEVTGKARKKTSSGDWAVDLGKQMQLWKANPAWGDREPVIDVKVPKGSLCSLFVEFDVGLPPDAVYNIVIDPDNKRVFKNIEEVISRKVILDEGSRQVVELEQAAIWKFLWWSGTISVHVLVDQNREDHSMKFTQVKAGFMKKFEGCWRVEPVFVDEEVCSPFKPRTSSEYNACTRGNGRIGSRVSLEQLLQPAIVPPPPISWYLRGITSKTTEMLINDLIAETIRIKGVANDNSSGPLAYNGFGPPPQESSDCLELDSVINIKERWALRRRNARQNHLRVS